MAKRTSGTVGDAAAAFIEFEVGDSLGWIARPQPTQDFGIDMQVELQVDGRAAGQLLALQVKGGPSYFKRQAPGGWWHGVSARHAMYWSAHALPVVVVLVDHKRRVSYWAEVRVDTLVPTRGGRFKLFIPAENRVAEATQAWSGLLDAHRGAAEHRFEGNLSRLPPSVSRHLQTSHGRDPIRVALLADILTQGGGAARAASLALAHTAWLEKAGPGAAIAVANFCAEHDLHEQLRVSLLLAAQLDVGRAAEFTAQAALAAGDDRGVAEQFLVEARTLASAMPSPPPVVDVAEAHLHPERVDPQSAGRDEALIRRLSAASDEPVLLHYLGAAGLRRRQFTEAAAAFRRFLEISPADSARMLDLAHVHSYRGTTQDAAPDDLDRAIQWADAARDQRRTWGGSTVEALSVSIRALGLQRRFAEALSRALPLPEGTATNEEAAHPEIARLAAATARQLGRSHAQLTEIIERIGDPQRRADTLDEFAADATADPAHRIAVLERLVGSPQAIDDPLLFVQRIFGLAVLGVDRSADIERLAPGTAPPGTAALVSAAAAHQVQPGHVDPALRQLALTDALAAEILVDAHSQAGQLDRAAAVASRAYDLFGQQRFLELQVHLAIRGDARSDAEELMHRGLSSGRLRGELVAQFQSLLGELAAQRGDYASALPLFEASAASPDAPTNAGWNAAKCAANLEQWDRARRTIDNHRLHARSIEAVSLWHTCMTFTGWNADTAEEALTLAHRYATDTDLAVALLGSVIQLTQASTDESDSSADVRPVVPNETRARAFTLLERLKPASVIKIEEADDPLEALQPVVPPAGVEEARSTLRRVAAGRYPVGAVAAVRSGPYGLLLARRPLGDRFASRIESDVHEAENRAAIAALDGPVVVDLSTLELAPDLGDFGALHASFSSVQITRSARRDLAVSVVEARAETAAVGSLRWSAPAGKPTFVESNPEEQLRVLDRVQHMLEMAQSCQNVALSSPFTVLPQLAESAPALPWLEALELAAQHGLPLWADDAALREMARIYGISTFGTVNLIEAQRLSAVPDDPEQARRIADDHVRFVRRLRELGIVDQPLTEEELLTDVRTSRGAVTPTGRVLSRSAWWTENPSLGSWLRVAAAIRATGAPIEPWLGLVIAGFLARADPDAPGPDRLCMLLAVSAEGIPVTAATARAGLAVYRRFAADSLVRDQGDGLQAVVTALHTAGLVSGDPAQLLYDLLHNEPSE